LSRAEIRVQTKRLGKEPQGRVIEQRSSWGTFQKKQEKNTERTWGLGPSRVVVVCCSSLRLFGSSLSFGWSGPPSWPASRARRRVKRFS